MLCVHAYYTVVHFAVATDNNHLALRMCALFLMETVDSVLSHRLWYGRMACTGPVRSDVSSFTEKGERENFDFAGLWTHFRWT